MKTQNIVKHIIDNGGITYDLRTQSLVTTGWAVSAHKELEKVVPLSDFNYNTLEQYITKNNTILTIGDNMLGAWVSGDNVYLDVTTVVHDKDQAIAIAKNAEQLAIFNLETFEEVPTM